MEKIGAYAMSIVLYSCTKRIMIKTGRHVLLMIPVGLLSLSGILRSLVEKYRITAQDGAFSDKASDSRFGVRGGGRTGSVLSRLW